MQMSNRSILFTSPGRAELCDAEIPSIGAGEVLVKLLRSTVSAGTERAILTGDPNVNWKGTPVPFPRKSGYSSVGIVEAIGEGVTRVAIGDRVACSWSVHAQYCKLRERCVYPIGDDLSDADAALVHIATFPLAAIRKCHLEIGESAIVMGLGVLGLVTVSLLRIAGAAPIIAVDPVAQKRSLALTLGADYALDPNAPDFAQTVRALTNGGAHVAIEITGRGEGLDTVLDCMRRFGRVALLGCTRSADFTIDYYKKVHGPGITLIGAHTNARPLQDSFSGWWSEADDAMAIINLIQCKRLDLARLVEEVVSPADAPRIYTRLASSPAFPIIQFDWRKLK